MALASADFGGIVALDDGAVAQLSQRLRGKETGLAEALVRAFGFSSGGGELSLTEALQEIATRLATFRKESSGGDSLKKLVIALDTALWGYLEALEGAVSDLFQELERTPIGVWDRALAEVEETLFLQLKIRCDELLKCLNLLEELLWKSRSILEEGASKWVSCIQRMTRSLLDQHLFTNLRETLTFLETHHKNWCVRFEEYQTFRVQAEESLAKADVFVFLKTLPLASQAVYRSIQRRVRVWELDSNARGLLTQELVREFNDKEHPEEIYAMFREYFVVLKGYLFASSRSIKEQGRRVDEGVLVEGLSSGRAELNALHTAIARYREFLLRTDPNPYVRTRWGFSEWVVGPEPESCRQLLQVEYRLEDLDRLYDQMIKSLSDTPKTPDPLAEKKVEGEIREVVRGMIQPLGSRRVVQGELRHLMQLLERYDELGSRSPTAVSIVAEALLKALSYDLRYVMLFGEADFHRLYTIHHELVAPLLAEPVHAAQREKLKQFGNRVLKWISKGHWDKHVGDVEQYLQSFQDYLKALSGDTDTVRQQILDFRYLLGSLYHRLLSLSGPGKAARSRFEALDHCLDQL